LPLRVRRQRHVVAREDDTEAWILFPDRDAIERAMTAVVRRNVAQANGIEIAGTAPLS
jgi:hypothetical protein